MSPDSDHLGRQPSRMPKADLGSAFGAPDRTRSLSGRLAPVRPPAQVPGEEPPVRDPEDGPGAPQALTAASAPVRPPAERPTPPAARSKTSPQPTSATRQGKGAIRPVVVYLPAALRGRLRAAATAETTTHTDLVLAALDATHSQLAGRFSAADPAPSSLFAAQGRRRRRQRQDEPQVQVSLRPVSDDLAVIDGLVETVGASSRSAMIAAALDLYLPS
jgi:hypothetical protein